MVRKKGYTPKHCHHKHKNLGYVCLNGRAIYTGPWGASDGEAEYRRLIGEWNLNGCQLPRRMTDKGVYLVKHLIADFWRWAEQHYRKHGEPTREMNNIRDAARPLLDTYGHTEADKFGVLALKALRESIVEQGRWARTTINSRINIIRRMFKWAAANEMVPASVYVGLCTLGGLEVGRTNAREPEPVHPVSESDMHAVLPYVSAQLAAMIQLQWRTGMRPGEVVLMRWKDIACDEQGWLLYCPSRHKNEHKGKDRRVWLGKEARATLSCWRKIDQNAFIFSPLEAERERRAINHEQRKTRLTPSQDRRDRRRSYRALRRYGSHYTTDSFRQAVSRACRKAGVKQWTPNQVRHAFASRARSLFGLDLTKAVMGHSSSTITDNYTRSSIDERAKKVLSVIG